MYTSPSPPAPPGPFLPLRSPMTAGRDCRLNSASGSPLTSTSCRMRAPGAWGGAGVNVRKPRAQKQRESSGVWKR